MNCEGCGREQPLVEGHGHEGLGLCGQCVDWMEMIRRTDARVLVSILAAYRSRKATREKEAGVSLTGAYTA